MQLLALSNLTPICRRSSSSNPPLCCHAVPPGFESDIASVAHNKVLVAAAVSTAVGQLSKPLTSAFLYGHSFDFKAAVRSGGFPSTHSSAVVATATALGLERGFSDSIFGLSIVYAALVMYDAQGVRREVGKHARTINKVLLESSAFKADEESSAEKQADASVQDLQNSIKSGLYLYERVGHTELEVLAGAFFGFLVSLTVCSLM